MKRINAKRGIVKSAIIYIFIIALAFLIAYPFLLDTNEKEIISDTKNYSVSLGGEDLPSISFTQDEINAINAKSEITVGVYDNNFPITYFEGGAPKGIAIDLLKLIEDLGRHNEVFTNDFKFNIQKVPTDAENILSDVDIFACVNSISEQPNDNTAILSKSVYSSTMIAVGRYDNYIPSGCQDIAVRQNFKLYCRELLSIFKSDCAVYRNNPSNCVCKITSVDSTKAGLSAVSNGSAHLFCDNAYAVNYYMQSPQYKNLKIAPSILFKMATNLLFNDSEADILSGFNKIIENLPAETVEKIIIKNTIEKSYSFTFSDFWYENKDVILVVISMVVLVAILATLLMMYIRNNQKNLQDTNAKLQKSIVKAEKASKARSAFFARISHEIRTPINAIIGMTELAKQNLSDKELADSYLEKVDYSSKILLNLMNDILDISAIESVHLKISSNPFNLKQLITSLASVYSVQCENKSVIFNLEIDNLVNETVVGDELRVNQIILNLLSNAVKFTPGGRTIRFIVSQLSATETVANIRFIVADTGCGMSEEVMSRIFIPFEQGDETTSLKYGGTGLGLSITKNLIELMDGSIRVNSDVDRGSTFIVDIPFGIPHDGVDSLEECKSAEVADIFKGKRILIAEDNAINMEIAVSVLNTMGIECDCAVNGRQAVELFEKSPKGTFDAVILDIQMPILNGYETASEIRGMRNIWAKKVPIIAMSANVLAEDIKKCLDCGMNVHIEKPISINALVKTLKQFF